MVLEIIFGALWIALGLILLQQNFRYCGDGFWLESSLASFTTSALSFLGMGLEWQLIAFVVLVPIWIYVTLD